LQGLIASAARASGGRRGIKAAAMFRRDASPLPMYLLRRELFLAAERRCLHPLPDDCDAAAGLRRDDLAALRDQAAALGPINQISFFELSTYMRHMLLRDADVFSMAHGLEVRVPLLDHKLVELAASLTGNWKRPDPRPKPLLVDAVGPRLPTAVYTSPKRGFTFPWSVWLRGALKERAGDSMHNRRIWEALGFDPKAPAALFDRFIANDPRVAASQVLALLVLGDYAARHRLESAT
jgi:asparagine synthase (glutamine-hydrolysing)